MPHRIALLVYPGFELLDASGPASVFNGANRALRLRARPPLYVVETVSSIGGAVCSSSGISLHTKPLSRIPPGRIDTLLIVGAEEKSVKAAIAAQPVRQWVPRCAAAAKRFGSVCSGVFILAALGLLNGKRVATHWNACAQLAGLFPSVTVDPETLYVVDGKAWTSAGVSTGIDMALAMVSHDLDPGIAGEVAKQLVLYARRPGYQSQFSPLLEAQMAADRPFDELLGWVQSNLHCRLDVPALAARVGQSERTFYRRFVKATGKTPARFVELLRLDAARLLLLQDLPIKVIAARVGLSRRRASRRHSSAASASRQACFVRCTPLSEPPIGSHEPSRAYQDLGPAQGVSPFGVSWKRVSAI